VKGNSLTAYICGICCGRSVIWARNLTSFTKTFKQVYFLFALFSFKLCPYKSRLEERSSRTALCTEPTSSIIFVFAIFSVIFYMCNFFFCTARWIILWLLKTIHYRPTVIPNSWNWRQLTDVSGAARVFGTWAE
jgi:hypothetical protein